MSTNVTIIVIAFNEERRIRPCLEALIHQDTDIVYEVVVVDDGSSDNTAALVSELSTHDPRIHLIRHDHNRGRGAARSTGQAYASTPLIGFVDADIIVPPSWLERCVAALGDADAVSGVAVPDGDCAVVWRIARATVRPRPGSAEITGNNVLFRATTLAKAPYDATSRLGEDFRQAKTMVRQGLLPVTIPDLHVEHRETKTYPKAARWMFQQGRDATALLVEFRVIRLPDVAWLSWLLGTLTVALATALGELSFVASLSGFVALTSAITVLFTGARFRATPHPLRWCRAALLNWPLITLYMLGRSAGAFTGLRSV